MRSGSNLPLFGAHRLPGYTLLLISLSTGEAPGGSLQSEMHLPFGMTTLRRSCAMHVHLMYDQLPPSGYSNNESLQFTFGTDREGAHFLGDSWLRLESRLKLVGWYVT